MRRFFSQEIDEKKGTILLNGEEYHHLRDVLRLSEGERVIVLDGRGREYLASVEELKKGKGVLRILDVRVARAPGIRVSLAQALPKASKMDLIVQKTTELGVWEVYPLFTERSIPRLKGQRAEERLKRWRRIAIEAIKQCRSPFLPSIHPIHSFEEFLKLPFDGLKLLFWEGEERRRLRDLEDPIRSSDALLVAIGPEGGFSEKEVDMASQAGFITVGLGERVLRTETAPISIISILLYIGGEMG